MNLRAATLLDGDQLLTPEEVAAVFGVEPRTVTKWAAAGLLAHVPLPGGRRRYRRSVIEALKVSG